MIGQEGCGVTMDDGQGSWLVGHGDVQYYVK